MIVFINTPTGRYKKEREEEYNTIPPIGLGYIATVAKRIGFKTRLIDGEYFGLSPLEIAKKITQLDPSIVGINFISPTYSISKEICLLIKEFLKSVKLIAGGVHATLAPKKILQEIPDIEFVCVGHGEETIYRYLKGFPLRNIPNIVFKERDNIIRTRRLFLDREKIESYSLDRELFQNSPNIEKKNKIEAYILGSRGCPFSCSFCAAPTLYEGRFFSRSIKSIMKEIEKLQKLYGVNYIRFIDDLFLTSEKRLRKFSYLLKEKGVKRSNLK